MKPAKRFPKFNALLSIWAMALLPTAFAQDVPQQPSAPELKETLRRTGVFFRADAPYALRNRADPHLPVHLEIINGVEKTGRSAVTEAGRYVTREPLKLEGANIYLKPAGPRRQFAQAPLILGAGKDFSFDARTEGQPLIINDRLKMTLEVPREKIENYLKQHYIGGPFDVVDLWVAFRVADWPAQSFYLRVRLNAPPLPALPGWYRGDMHYHSGFTDNAAERGYPLGVTKQAALHADFNWLLLTDHATDLTPEIFSEQLREVAKYRDGRFLFIRGEELTLASGKDTLLNSVHLVAAPSPDDPERGFAAPGADASAAVIMTGDGSPANPALPLDEALKRIAAAGGFAYAAHPFDPVSPILRGGAWDLDVDFLAAGGKSLKPGLVGLEPWNRATALTADNARDPFCLRRDADPATCFQPDKEADHYARLEKGIELGWRPLLLKGLAADETANAPPFRVFLAAGSDAHGDFNYQATMDVVDFLSKPSRGISGYAEDNALGKLSTVVHCPHGMGPKGENVLRALREGRSVLSNGPLLMAGFDRNSNGSLDDPEDTVVGQFVSFTGTAPSLQLAWASSREFGPLVSLRLYVGSRSGESGAEEIPIPSGKELASAGLLSVNLDAYLGELAGSWGYVRLEARTRSSSGEEFRCYTNPIWLRVSKE